MNIKPKKLIVCLAVPLAVGGLAAVLSMSGMRAFAALEKPPLTPPAWVFPVVWTALYLMMGLASYLVSEAGMPRDAVSAALTVYACQLALNFFWPILFFRFALYLFAFFWLIALWLAVLATFAFFHKLDKTAGKLLLPYLLWVTFAGYLNLGVYLLNK